MTRSRILVWSTALALCTAGAGLIGSARAQTAMQQCGQQYQAAKAAGTLNGVTWNQFRGDCVSKLKAQPVSAAPAATAAAAPATPAAAPMIANPLKPAPAPVAAAPAATAPAATAPAVAVGAAPAKPLGSTTPLTGGRAAFVARERQCGAEWRNQKASLVAQTPGLTWPKYLSLCNTRLKAAGQ